MAPKKHQNKSERLAKSSKGCAVVDKGFITFSDVVENSNQTSVVLGPSPIYTGANPEIQVIAKRLSKKNSSTRAKALNDLKIILEGDINIISPEFIAFFTFIYEKLVFDNDRYVRQEANVVLAFLLLHDRKQFKPYIPTILGPMWLTMCDPVNEVSKSAEFLFETAFPNPGKRNENITLHLLPLIRYVRKSICSSAAELSDMSSSSAEEADERYERVVSSALFSFAKLIPIMSESIVDKSSIESFLGDHVLPLIIDSSRQIFRKASLQIVINLCGDNPAFVSCSLKDQLFTLLTSLITSENSSVMIPQLLEALVCFFKGFPVLWEKIDLSNFLFPYLRALMEGYLDLCSPALLPIISTIPLENLFAEAPAFHNFLLELIRLSRIIDDTSKPLIIFAEISTFLMIRIMKITGTYPTAAKTLFYKLSQELADVSISLLKCHLFDSIIPLLTHLHKQSLYFDDDQFTMWEQDFSISLQKTLLDTAALGIKGDFNTYVNQIMLLYSSIAQVDYKKSTGVVKHIGCFSSLCSLFCFAGGRCSVLSATESDLTHEIFLLWTSVVLKTGSIILGILQSNSRLISLTPDQVHSFIDCAQIFNAVSATYNLSLQSSEYDIQLKFAIGIFHEMAHFIHQFSSFRGQPMDSLSNLLRLVNERQSMLGYVLIIKDGLISSWEQFSLYGGSDTAQNYIVNSLNNIDELTSMDIALAIECQKKQLLEKDDLNERIMMWVELTEYFIAKNFETPSDRIKSHFIAAFISNGACRDSKIIQDEFQVITCWKSIESLFPLPGTIAHSFCWALVFQLKMILFFLTGLEFSLPQNQRVTQSHFLSLLGNFFDLVSCGHFPLMNMQAIYSDLGILNWSLWKHLHSTLVNSFDSGKYDSQVPDLVIAIISAHINPHMLSLDPNVCFEILQVLVLLKQVLPEDNPKNKIDVQESILTFSSYLKTIGSSDLSNTVAEAFQSCRHQSGEADCLLRTITQILDSETNRSFFCSYHTENESRVCNLKTDFIEVSRITKGMTAYYLSKIPSSIPSAFEISAVKGTLLEIDEKVGEDPYYTLGYNGREIQTERFRIIFPKRTLSFTEDIIHSSVPTTINDRLANEIVQIMQKIVDDIDGNRFPTKEIHFELHFVVLILKHVKVLEMSSAYDLRLLFAFTRHAIIRLMSCHPLGAALYVQYGMEILLATVQSDIGVGSGLWIHSQIYPLFERIIQSLKSAQLVLSSSERSLYILKFLSVLNLLLSTIPSALVMSYASSIVQVSLFELDSNNLELGDAVISTSRSVWICKALDPVLLHLKYEWEPTVLKMCVDRILAADANLATKTLDQAMALVDPSNSFISANLFTKSSEIIAWQYMSLCSHSYESRLVVFRVLDAWISQVKLVVDIEKSMDEEAIGNLLVQQVLEPFLRLFETNVIRCMDSVLGVVSLDSLSSCVCGHIGRAFCPSLEPGEHVDVFGILFQWLLLLQKIDSYCISAPWSHRFLIGTIVGRSSYFQCVMRIFVGILMTIQLREFPPSKDLSQTFSFPGENDPSDSYRICFLFYAFARTIMILPAATRAFYLAECSRAEAAVLEKFVESYINDILIQREISIIEAAQSEALDIRCSALTGEIITTYVADEVSVEMAIKLPRLYPLKNVEVECQRRMGINEGRWRRWTLQIIQLLSQRDGSVFDAILFWKRNLDKEFEGVEPCPICYSVLDPKSLALPTLQCPTCKNKFHPPCLYKWFNTSGKSKCVLCQQPFFH